MQKRKPENVLNRKPASSGTDAAPTAKAAERERERHAIERELGRTPAGQMGQKRDHRSPNVTREQLEEAAREADRRVASKSPTDAHRS